MKMYGAIEGAELFLCHCEERAAANDAAISLNTTVEIASLHFISLAMTSLSSNEQFQGFAWRMYETDYYR